MKTVLASALIVIFSSFAHADNFDRHYSGHIMSASSQVSVKYQDGSVQTFDVSNVNKGTVTNESYMKVVSLKAPVAGSCTKIIGELASDYSFVIKTDENELVTLNFKASTPEAQVRITGNCDGGISGEFSIYISNDTQLPMSTAMSQEPAGAPAADARYYGDVVQISPQITVRGNDGVLRQLDSSGLISGGIYNDLNMVEFSNGGASTKCGERLGKLASDFTVTVRTRKGMVRTATIPAGSSQVDVDVFGACQGNSLTQLQLAVRNGSRLQIQ